MMLKTHCKNSLIFFRSKPIEQKHKHQCCSVGNYWEHLHTASIINLSEDDNILIQAIFDKQGIKYDPASMQKDINKLSKAITKGMGSKFVYGDDDYLLTTMMELNLNRFGFNKSLAKVVDLNQAFRETSNLNDFKKKAGKIVENYNTNYLRTEYNLAVASSQNGKRYIEQKQESNIFPYLQYQTAGDEKVRATHKALDGKVFKIGDKQAMSLYPPNGYGCRCEFVQIDSDEAAEIGITTGAEGKGLLGTEHQNMVKQGFDKNVGDTGDIFALNKNYANQLNGINTDPNKFNYVDAKLPGIEVIQSKLKAAYRRPNKTPDRIMRSFARNEVIINNRVLNVMEDQTGRLVAIEKATLQNKIQGANLNPAKELHQLYPGISKVLANPDEVWLINNGDDFEYRYIKYYKDIAIVAKVNVSRDTGLELIDWYKTTTNDPRVGILISSH